MHHIWKLESSITLVKGYYQATIRNNKTRAEVNISLPQSGFFPDGRDLGPKDAEDVIAGMISFLNMTTGV